MSSGCAATIRARCQSSGIGFGRGCSGAVMAAVSRVPPLRNRAAVGSPPVSALDLLLVAGVALLAGGINSIAGGGSLILFPTLVALGLGPGAANVHTSVAQWPGYLGGGGGSRDEYAGQRGRLLRFGAVAVLGGTT